MQKVKMYMLFWALTVPIKHYFENYFVDKYHFLPWLYWKENIVHQLK